MLFSTLKIELQLFALLLALTLGVNTKQLHIPTDKKLVSSIQTLEETPILDAGQRLIKQSSLKPKLILTQIGTEQSEQLSSGSQKDQASSYKLPSYFNYELYRRFYGKPAMSPVEHEFRRRLYLRTALKVFEQRALFRTQRLDSMPSVNELSDMSIEELEVFRKQQTTKRSSSSSLSSNQIPLEKDSLSCCNYDQIYKRIIELLNSTISIEDLRLSRAIIDELEQKPMLKGILIETSEGIAWQDQSAKQLFESTPISSSTSERNGSIDKQLGNKQEKIVLSSSADNLFGEKQESETAEIRKEKKTFINQALQADIERQVAEQLAGPRFQELKHQYSAYFEQPVELRVRPLKVS